MREAPESRAVETQSDATDEPSTRQASSSANIAPRRAPPIAILVGVSMVSPLALNIFMPSILGIVDEFGTTYGRAVDTITLFIAAVALSQIAIGPLSDRYGRRPVLLGGFIVFLVATILCRFAPTIDWLIAARVLQAAGGCTGIVLGRAIVRDLYGRSKSASMIGYVTMGMAVAPMVAPAIGGYLDGLYGWRASFDLLFVLGVVITLAAFFFLHETHPSRGTTFKWAKFKADHLALTRVPAFWAYAATGAAASCVFFSFLGGAPFVTGALLGMSPQEYGLYFIFVAGGYIVGNFCSGRLAGGVGPDRMIFIGNVLSIVAIAMLILFFALGATHPMALFGPVFFTSMANGLSLPSSIASALSIRPDLAGAAAGISGALQMGAGAIVAEIVASWLEVMPTIWPLVTVMGIMALTALVTGLIAEAKAPPSLRAGDGA